MKKSVFLIAAVFMLSFITSSAYAQMKTVSLSSEGNAALMEELEITIPKKEKSDNITRAEFVSAAVSLIKQPYVNNGKIPYTDIDEHKAKDDIACALELGIISESDTFRPDDLITYQEAYSVSVKLLGRNFAAQYAGGYPTGYIKTATECGINNGLTDIGGEYLTFNDMCTMFINMGKCPLYEKDGRENLKEGESIFEKYYGLYGISGIVTADQNTNLYDEDAWVNDACIVIDDTEYFYEKEAPIGCRVAGYAYEKDGEQYIAYIEPYRNTKKVLDLKNIDETSTTDRLVYEEENRTKSLNIERPAAFIYNGKASGKMMVSDIVNMKNGTVELIDNDNDGRYEVFIINEYTTMVVKSVSVADKRILGENTKENADGAISKIIDLSSEDMKFKISSAKGDISLSDIKSGSLLSVYISKDGTMAYIYLNNNAVTGVLNTVNAQEQTITVDGKVYDYTEGFYEAYSKSLKLSCEYTFLLTDSGMVAAVGAQSTSGLIYGYLVKVTYDEEEEELRLKIFDEYENLNVYECLEKVKFDGETLKKDIVYLNLSDNKETKRQLLRFSLKNGKVNCIDTANKKGRLEAIQNPMDSMVKYEFPAAAYNKVYWIAENNSFHPYVYLSNSTKIFVVAEGNVPDNKRAVIKSSNYFYDSDKRNQPTVSTADKKATEFYDVTRGGVVGAMVVYDQAASNPEVSDDSPLGIVYQVVTEMTPYDEIVYAITIFANGEYRRYYTTEELYEESMDNGGIDIEQGDLVRYILTNDNCISAIKCDYDMSEKKLNYILKNNENSTHLAKGVLYSGILYDVDGNMLSVIPTGVPGIAPDPADETARFSFRLDKDVYVVDKDGKMVYISDQSEMLPYLHAGKAESSNIFIRTNDGRVDFAVIYK